MRALLPQSSGTYWEPFLGGGAVFFDRVPPEAHLSDANRELIGTYRAIRDECEAVIAGLEQHRQRHFADLARPDAGLGTHDRFGHYYRVRALDWTSLAPAEAAARMLYLNRTCFNGLYRVNRQGSFNVPAGRYRRPDIVQADNLRRCAVALRGACLQAHGFEEIDPGEGDFVYLDPPYDYLPGTKGFVGYAAGGFSTRDQVAVRDLAIRCIDVGARVLVSNHDTPLIRDLYAGSRFCVHPVTVPRRVGPTASSRQCARELLIVGAGPD